MPQPTAPSATASERRKEPRLRSLLGGQIMVPALGWVPCQVRNHSPAGALVIIDASVALPDEFELQYPARGQSIKMRRVWRDGDRVGLVATEPPPGAPVGLHARLIELEAENARLREQMRKLRAELADRIARDA